MYMKGISSNTGYFILKNRFKGRYDWLRHLHKKLQTAALLPHLKNLPIRPPAMLLAMPPVRALLANEDA